MEYKYKNITLEDLYTKIMSDKDAWKYYIKQDDFKLEDLDNYEKCRGFILNVLKNAEKTSLCINEDQNKGVTYSGDSAR